ncbi:MFS transporter [Litorilituus sediminis]|uniref:MFS transporter n=1 Tax=Litorilituus sediminis TaxID=718192 RepID=A0A4P6P7Y8_9GAMM|nr:MFS transporter [Litorilituus sediminis]QBG37654.1 MFS transporter [Litorilituus sediminis]
MLLYIVLALVLLVSSALVLTRIYSLPKNISLLFIAQPLVGCSAPIMVFIGGILSSQIASDPSLATLPITLMILGVAAASIPAAMLARVKGRKFAIFTGLFFSLSGALIAMLSALQASFFLFAIASLLIGVGGAFTHQLRFAAIESTHNSQEIPKVLSILMLSGVFAAFLGPETAVVAKDWLDSPHQYAGSFLMLAGLISLSMVLISFFDNPELKHETTSGDSRPLSEIIKQPIFIISICAATIGYALMSYLMTATPLSMHHMQAHSLHDTKWVIQSHIAAMYIPSLFAPWLIQRFALRGILVLGTIIYTLVTIIALSGQHVMHYWWALMLLGVGWNFLFLTGTSLLPQSYNTSERHKVQATNDFILFGFQALASLMAGWMLFKAGWHWLVLSSIPFVVILYIVAVYYWQKEKSICKT